MRKHLLRNPHKIKKTPHAWWYEENGGIDIVVHREAIQSPYESVVLRIPWKQIRDALARKDKK